MENGFLISTYWQIKLELALSGHNTLYITPFIAYFFLL